MTKKCRPYTYADLQLAEVDPAISGLIHQELGRQRQNIELIASENTVALSVLQAVGSVLSNKYAEGIPGERYYGGCEVVDQVEMLAIQRAKDLYGAEHANVQPHSGSNANQAIYFATLQPGDTLLLLTDGLVEAGRHGPCYEPGPRRPPDPWSQGELLGT